MELFGGRRLRCFGAFFRGLIAEYRFRSNLVARELAPAGLRSSPSLSKSRGRYATQREQAPSPHQFFRLKGAPHAPKQNARHH